MEGLFREQVLAERRRQAMGSVLVIAAPSGWLMAAIALLTVAGLIGFLNWGEYARRATVIGQLVPDRGLVEVPMPYPGVVVERLVSDGDQVREGALLFVIAARRSSLDAADVDASLLSEIEIRLAALGTLATAAMSERDSELRALAVRAQGAEQERFAVERQLAIQQRRRAAMEADRDRIGTLVAVGLMAAQQVRAREDELLSVDASIQGLAREIVGLNARGAELDAQRALIEAGSDRARAALSAQAAELRQQASEMRLRTGTAVRAPIAGTVTALSGQEGEILAASSRLVAIIPDGSSLEARLFLPTRAAGLIAPGQEVALRYAAYPYQRFGVQRGRVQSIPRALATRYRVPPSIAALGPVYELQVTLESQGISTIGGVSRLRPGMELEADILLERRPLIRWLLEPVEALAGPLR
jgi:membrane fusion protein